MTSDAAWQIPEAALPSGLSVGDTTLGSVAIAGRANVILDSGAPAITAAVPDFSSEVEADKVLDRLSEEMAMLAPVGEKTEARSQVDELRQAIEEPDSEWLDGAVRDILTYWIQLSAPVLAGAVVAALKHPSVQRKLGEQVKRLQNILQSYPELKSS